MILNYYDDLISANILFQGGIKEGLAAAASDAGSDFILSSERYKNSSKLISSSKMPMDRILTYIDKINSSEYPGLRIEKKQTINAFIDMIKDFSLYTDSQSRITNGLRYLLEPGHAKTEAMKEARTGVEQMKSLLDSPYVGDLVKPILAIYSQKFQE